MRVPALFLIAVLLGGCLKDDLDLGHNPFDPAYDGPPLFSIEASYVEEIVTSEGLDRRLTQRMRVDRSRMLLPNPTFIVQAVRTSGGEQTVSIPSNSLDGDLFDLITHFSTQGAEYCWELRLTNVGSIGARNTVCSIAD